MTERRSSSTIGWFCTYTPEEIIVAAGLDGRRILGGPGVSARADAYLHPNLCAYVRSCLTSALEGEHNDLAGIIGVDSCDAMRRLYDAWIDVVSPDFSHMLALPHRRDSDGADFFALELRRLASCLGEYCDRRISDDDLRHAISEVNETRSLLNELTTKRPYLTSLSDSGYYEIINAAMTAPRSETNSRLKDLLSSNTTTRDKESIGIILAGGTLDDPLIAELIQESGGHILKDDLCCGSRYFEELTSTEGDPMSAIAERYLFRAPCARMCDTDERAQRLLGLIEETNAKGLIYYSVKFCDPHMLDWVTIIRELQARNIPALRCETDYSTGGHERMRIRIEAFMEMLR